MVAFTVWQDKAAHPMLPLRFFRSRTFAASNVASLLFTFGMFGSIFLLAQFLQTALGYSPLEAGLRTLPWTAMPLLVAPIAGPLSDRSGGRPFLVSGLALQAIEPGRAPSPAGLPPPSGAGAGLVGGGAPAPAPFRGRGRAASGGGEPLTELM